MRVAIGDVFNKCSDLGAADAVRHPVAKARQQEFVADPLDLARAALMVSNFWAASVMALPFSVEGFDVRDFTAFVGSLLLSRFPATV